MRINRLVVLALLFWSIACKAQQTETPSPFTFTIETSIFSKFVWRGFADYSGPSWQTVARTSWKKLEGSWWIDSGAKPGGNIIVREHDIDVHYSFPVDHTNFTAGYTAYCMLLGEDTAHEVYLTASRGRKLVGTLGVYQNIGLPNGTYVSGSLTRAFPLKRGWIVQLSSSLGFNRKMFIDESTFSDATATITFNKSSRRGVTILPTVGFSKGLNKKYFANQFYAGMTLRFSK